MEAQISRYSRNINLRLPLTICEPINDNSFWRDLCILKILLLPLCGCSNILQHDKSYLYEVLHSFRYFYQVFRDTEEDGYFSEKMCGRLEKRW